MSTSSGSRSLRDELAALFSFLALADPPRQVRVIEVLPNDYDQDGCLRIPRSRLLTVDAFGRRFERLVHGGYSWINLNYLGQYGGASIVTVEVPLHATGALKPSVNYSGPPRAVVESANEAAAVLQVDDFR